MALTPAGLALINRALDAHVENQQAVVAGLTHAEREELSLLLEKLLADNAE